METGRDRAVPDTVTFRRFADGLEIALLPPPVAVAPVADSAGGACQACVRALEEHVVLRATCRAPHPEACSTYDGSCSTCGGREIRFTRTA
jgi:hypothetical protein